MFLYSACRRQIKYYKNIQICRLCLFSEDWRFCCVVSTERGKAQGNERGQDMAGKEQGEVGKRSWEAAKPSPCSCDLGNVSCT